MSRMVGVQQSFTSLWTQRAACRGAPRDLFVTPGDEDDEPPYPSADALWFCDRCDVRVECLGEALANPDYIGIWGGTTTYQRSLLRRQTIRVRCPACASSGLVILEVDEASVDVLCLACGMSWGAREGSRR